MRGLLATWRAAWAEAVANPRGFWAQFAIMAANDTVWIVFWVIFFRQVDTLRGWQVDTVLVLLAISATSVGVSIGALANCRWIGSLAAGGQLDAALTLPVAPLPYLLVRRVDPANVGDIGFGLALFGILGNPNPARLAVYAFGVACATVIVTSFIVLMGSLVFFLGPNPAPDLGFHAVLLFSMYPVDVFGGAMKLILYGVVPAALVASVPARLVQDFNPATAAALAAASAGFALAAWATFQRGLRHYTSGATWTDA
jgi:ABC-2 type transport system permease protein